VIEQVQHLVPPEQVLLAVRPSESWQVHVMVLWLRAGLLSRRRVINVLDMLGVLGELGELRVLGELGELRVLGMLGVVDVPRLGLLARPVSCGP